VTINGIWIVIGFTEHLQIATTSNCTAIAISHTPRSLRHVLRGRTRMFRHQSWLAMSSPSVLTFFLADDCPITQQHHSATRSLIWVVDCELQLCNSHELCYNSGFPSQSSRSSLHSLWADRTEKIRESSVGIATAYGQKIYLLNVVLTGPPRFFLHKGYWGINSEVRRPGREADDSSWTSVEVKKACGCTYTKP
jgi:hypothetical protein